MTQRCWICTHRAAFEVAVDEEAPDWRPHCTTHLAVAVRIASLEASIVLVRLLPPW